MEYYTTTMSTTVAVVLVLFETTGLACIPSQAGGVVAAFSFELFGELFSANSLLAVACTWLLPSASIINFEAASGRTTTA